jgi:hypothetical protein
MRATSFLLESAADELARKLPSLNKTDYDTIDRLMQRISRRHMITGKKLHDLFVSKYGHTPDHWVKKIKNRLSEVDADKDDSLGYLKYFAKPAETKKKPEQKMYHGWEEYEKEHSKEKQPHEIAEEVESDEVKQINDFIEWSMKTLHVKNKPKFILSKDTEKAQAGHHTGVHSGNEIWVYIGNRNLIDIFRTIFHELVHQRQDELGMIKKGDSYPGSPIEAMADMLAGKYMKIYGKQHPEVFQ